MPIREMEFYHGAAFARLVRSGGAPVPVRAVSGSRSAYVVGLDCSLYIKYSTNRMSPWTFSFSREQQQELDELGAQSVRVLVVLVCGQDGIACLDKLEWGELLDDNRAASEWIRVARRPRPGSGKLD